NRERSRGESKKALLASTQSLQPLTSPKSRFRNYRSYTRDVCK
ncbi:unnamed protein product, partial [Brassica rapa subsp. trilocularis]